MVVSKGCSPKGTAAWDNIETGKITVHHCPTPIPHIPKDELVQRHFSIESLCNLNILNEHLESDLNKDKVKQFEVHEKEKLSRKWTRYEVIITGVKGSRVLWPKNQEVCNSITMIIKVSCQSLTAIIVASPYGAKLNCSFCGFTSWSNGFTAKPLIRPFYFLLLVGPLCARLIKLCYKTFSSFVTI